MKFFLSAAVILTTLCSNGQTHIDVLHYRFEIELTDASDTIKGKAIVSIRFSEPTDKFSLDLTSINEKGKGMLAYSLMTNEKEIVTGKQSNEKLELVLMQPAKAGDIKTFIIEYKGIPADGLIISKNKYGNRTFFADNWPNRGHNWLPCHDDPADKATVEFIVTAPTHYQVVANGIQIEESCLPENKKLTHWKEDIPVSTKVMVIGVAEFSVNLAGYVNDCIPVYSWVYPENKKEGFYDYALAKDILPFFIKTVGPYAYKKLANVQSKTRFGGLENANTIFYAEHTVTGTRSSEELFVHEIAHQWFGNMATEKSFGHLWLSEGFATYFTILYMENKNGKDKAMAMRKEDREQVIAYSKDNMRTVVDTAVTDFMKMLNPYSYQKGSWVLHMLRSQLGDSVFRKAVRKYYSAYAGTVADSDDLRKIFESVSGKDLKQFFKQWLYFPGQPDLNVHWKYNAKTKKVEITIQQNQHENFSFPLEVLIKFSSGKTLKQVFQVAAKTGSFLVPVKQKPEIIIMDPGINLLFTRTVEEMK
jgi:aminopeptidase N